MASEVPSHPGPVGPLTLADVVAASFARTPDDRLRQVVTAVVRHAHAFVREVEPTVAEWEASVEYLTSLGKMCSETRQEFVLLSDVVGISMLVEMINDQMSPGATDSTVLGPFHMTESPIRALGADIFGPGSGTRCVIECRVQSTDGTPLGGAVVDVWQCDENGFYDVQKPDELPPGSGRGLFTADEEGRLWFRSVVPSYYPIPTDGPVGRLLAATNRHPYRPAHIHFIARAPGHVDLTTHIFVAGSPYLDSDAVFAVKESLVVTFTEVDDAAEAVQFVVPSPFLRARVELRLARCAVAPAV